MRYHDYILNGCLLVFFFFRRRLTYQKVLITWCVVPGVTWYFMMHNAASSLNKSTILASSVLVRRLKYGGNLLLLWKLCTRCSWREVIITLVINVLLILHARPHILIMLSYHHLIAILIFSCGPLTTGYHSFHDKFVATHIFTILILFLLL